MTTATPGGHTAAGGRLTQPEIAARYGVSEAAVRLYRRQPEWPRPAGKRGRTAEFDATEVDRAIRQIRDRPVPEEDADPDELLDAKQAADEAGIAYGTVRADISRGRWPQPDDGNRWKRRTVRDEMARRRNYRKGRT